MNTSAKALLFVLVCALLTPVVAQGQIVVPDTTSNWKKKLVFNFNVNQASFSSNWKAGGINSIGLNTNFNYKANYTDEKQSWDNELGFTYGFVRNSGQGFRKTLDRFFLDTKYGRKLDKNWDLFTSLNFASQFSPGYNYQNDLLGVEQELLISDLLAPAFATWAIGFEYHPADYFKVRISPFSPRMTIVNNNNGRFTELNELGVEVPTASPFGVEVGEDIRYEWFAFQLTADFDKDIAKNMNLKWRYLMFANYETLGEDGTRTIDHRLDLMITAKVNRFISVGLGGILLYDYYQDSQVQLSQAFNLGFMYSFQNYEEK
jgi:hypothetical protein